jgi:dihydrodipicolinate synthase/N-acetylneuraminate lyase
VSIAYEIGFRTFQIALPSWGALTDAEVLTYFRDVCSAFPDGRFLHYNLPRARRVLEGEDYRPLVEAIPNLVATKNTGGGLPRAAGLMRHAPELQHFFGEANFPHGCLYGECSLLSSFGPMTPHKTKALFEAGVQRRLAELFTLQKEFHDLMMDVLGPVLSETRIDGAYDKLLVRLGGFEEMPLRLLSPYQGLSEDAYQLCRKILHERYPEWVAESKSSQ